MPFIIPPNYRSQDTRGQSLPGTRFSPEIERKQMDNGVVRWFTLPPYETCGPLSQPRSDPKYLERVALKAVTI